MLKLLGNPNIWFKYALVASFLLLDLDLPIQIFDML